MVIENYQRDTKRLFASFEQNTLNYILFTFFMKNTFLNTKTPTELIIISFFSFCLKYISNIRRRRKNHHNLY